MLPSLSMSCERSRVFGLAVVTVLWAGCAGGEVVPAPGTGGCVYDTQCKGARLCVSGACVAPPPVQVVKEAPPPEPKPVGVPGAPAFSMFQGNAQHTGALAGPAPREAPKQVWAVTAGGPISGSPTLGPDGTIYFASHDHKLYAVTPAGEVKWEFATGDRVWSTPAVAADGTVYIGSDDDHLYAIDGETGEPKWRFRIGQCEPPTAFGPIGVKCDADGGPTIGPDGVIYVGGDGVYAIWPNGVLKWKLATPEHVRTAPALADDGTVYAGSYGDAFYAINPDGTKKWAIRTTNDIDSAPTVGKDGTIYFGCDDGKVYAVRPDGTIKWKVVTGNDVRSSPAITADGTIYVGSYDGYFYALAPDGQIKWRFAAIERIHSSPGIAQNGIVLFGSQDHHVYALSPAGKLLWTLTLADDIDTTPQISKGGVLYVAGDAGKLLAFE